MRSTEINKETKTMTVKKMLTALIATLLLVVPIQGLNISAANANGVTTTLATFTINGSDVEDGDVLVVSSGTTSVTVVATPTDNAATAVVSGATGLVAGDNEVSVLVTSSNNTVTQTYKVNVFVSSVSNVFSNDATLSALRVNGTLITAGQTVEVAPPTSSVTVVATTSNVNATSVVSGTLNLVTGLNDVSVTVTAEDGTTTRVYAFKVRVLALPSDVALATFTVNGQAVRNGGRVFLEPGTTGVAVVATPSDPSSSVVITGRTGLAAGANTLRVVVTSQAATTATYEVTLNVQAPSSNSSLVVLKVSGARVADGTTVFVPSGTTAVAVTAIPSDSAASVVVTGGTNLTLGDNTLTVVVTAEDGSTTTTTVTLNVLQNDDTSLAVFQYDGSDVTSGDEFDLDNGVTSVEITAEATSNLSTVEIIGEDALVPGRNVVRVQVTAQDTSVSTYRLIFNVAPNVDTTLESLTVGGQDATGGSVTLPAGTRATSVVAVTTDPFASYKVEGNVDLEAGENTVTVTVTAADGETTEDVVVTVTVEESVLSDDVSLETFLINGLDGKTNDTIELPYGTTRVNVKVVTTDPTTSYIVTGDGRVEPLVEGENELSLIVTAANGDSETTTINLVVLPISQNNAISEEEGLLVNDEAVDLALLDNSTGFINLPVTATTVKLQVKAESATSDVIANGRTMLPTVGRFLGVEKGVNEINIQVIPEAGLAFAKTYKLLVYVGGADATIKTLRVNATALTIGVDGSAALQTPLANGTTTATLFIEPTVAEKIGLGNGTKLEFEGGEATVTKGTAANTWNITGLVSGENIITVTVTPGDESAETAEYSILIPVALSSDKRIKTLVVNGVTVLPGATVALAKGAASANVVVTPESTVANAEVEGADTLVRGRNTLTITVTAEDETTQVYTLTAIVPNTVTAIVVPFPKVGVLTVDKRTNAKGNAAILAGIKKLKKETVGVVTISNNFLIAKDKPTAGPARASNAQKLLVAVKTNGFKTANYQLVTGPRTQKGTTITIFSY
jgi:hypothetical protein